MKTLARIAFIVALLLPFSVSAETITHSLVVGSRGSEVMLLQQALVKLGFLQTSPTGYFGTLTKKAVMAFQTANGLDPVGGVGPKTRKAINLVLTTNSQNSTQTVATTSTFASSTVQGTVSTPIPTPSPTPPAASENDPPIITIVGPNSILPRDTQSTQIVVHTDKSATCRWATLPGKDFSSMSSFTISGSTTSSVDFNYLGSGNLYQYYVKCEGVMNLKLSNEILVSFSVAAN